MKFLKGWIAAGCMLTSAVAWAQAISYDVITSILTIPSVSVGAAVYVNVTLQNVGPGYTFALKTATAQVPPGPALAAYDIASSVLTLPSVVVGTTTYDVTMQNIGNYTFVLKTASIAQLRQWTWMGGSNTANSSAVYGMQGAAAPGNQPGSRRQSISWTDRTGNFWLFGGDGYGLGLLNDLWMYNPVSGQWRWESGSNTALVAGSYGTQGVAGAGNVPGSREDAVSWSDSAGNLWLFGGHGLDSHRGLGLLNDLWKYTPSTGLWTWMSGSSTIAARGVYGNLGIAAPGNMPGGRSFAVSWTDSGGNLWLFGGSGYDSTTGSGGNLNDLWKFNPSSGLWTWVSGSTIANASGVYGTKGIAAAANSPGGRWDLVSWIDGADNLWLFGGYGLSPNGALFQFNDLWKFAPSTGLWTWMSGSINAVNAKGVYGTRGISASATVAGARSYAVSWTDSVGNFWLFGGAGRDSMGSYTNLNDLWQYSPSTGLWTWISGSNTGGAIGVYGTQGVASASNVPSARYSPLSWIDGTGNLWLFGGYGEDSTQFGGGYLNDLWKYGHAP